MKLNGRELKAYESIFIIAETASSHEGNIDLAITLTNAVNETGADAIKYQIQRADYLLSPSHHKYRRFREIEFSDSEWIEIVEHARTHGLFVIAEVFDTESFELAHKLEIGVFKVPTSDLTNPDLLPMVAATRKPIILSVGAATKEEIDFAVKTCEKVGNTDLILMHGFQSFPTLLEDTNFRLLDFLRSKYEYNVGFADHIDAESELALFMQFVAVGHGASVIEKHITLNRSLKGRDHYSALNPDEFTRMVSYVRDVERTYGSSSFGHSEAERNYRQLMKKMIVASRDIEEGDTITRSDIVFRRSDEKGLAPNDYHKILGHTRRRIPRYSVIRENDVVRGKNN